MKTRYISRIAHKTLHRIIVAMIEKKDDAIVEHFMGVYANELDDFARSGPQGNLQQFLYCASIANSDYWMRKLTLRGATDMNTQTILTNYELQRYSQHKDRVILV